MPYFPKADAPNVQPYWCPLCAAWYLPQAGPTHFSCCVAHPPGSCCHYGETKLVAEGTQPQPAYVPWVPVWPAYPNYTPWWVTTTTASDLSPAAMTTTTLAAWGKSMMGGDTSHMVDS